MNSAPLGTAYEWHRVISVLLCPTHFTEHDVPEVWPRGSRRQSVLGCSGGVTFPRVDGPHLPSPSLCRGPWAAPTCWLLSGTLLGPRRTNTSSRPCLQVFGQAAPGGLARSRGNAVPYLSRNCRTVLCGGWATLPSSQRHRRLPGLHGLALLSGHVERLFAGLSRAVGPWDTSLEKRPLQPSEEGADLFDSKRPDWPGPGVDTVLVPTGARPSPTLRAAFQNLAKDQRGEGGGDRPRGPGDPPSHFPCGPEVPWLLSDGGSGENSRAALSHGLGYSPRPGVGLIGWVTIALLCFSSLPGCLTSTYFRIIKDPRSAPPGTRPFSPLPRPINMSHLHENVQKMSFYIINYILQVIKILQPCPQQQPIHQQR